MSRTGLRYGGLANLSQQGALLNQSYNPSEDADVSVLSLARSVTSFKDALSVDAAQIVTPAANLSGTTSRIRILTSAIGIQGGAAWDVTFKFKLDDYTRRNPLFYNGGNSNSNKGITIMPYGTNLVIYSSDGTNAYRTATINCGFQSNVDYTLRFQWSGITDGIMTITVNGSVFTTSSNRGWDGAPSPTNTDFGAYADAFYYKGVYRSVVGVLGGVAMDFHPTGLITGFEYDTSVAGRLITFTANNVTSVYDGNSTYYFDYGYTIRRRTIGGTLFYFPHDTAGNSVSVDVGGGSSVVSEIAGSATKHNLYPSYLSFSADFFDRSNATIWNDSCRASAFYNATYPKWFHIDEVNLLTLRSYLNADYRGMFFPVFTETSVDERTFMEGFILSSVDKKGTDEIAVLNYTKDIRRAQRDINSDYITDDDGYIQLYFYNDLGENATGNFAKYQALIDAGDTTIGAGLTKYDVILISQPLKIPSNRTITVNCEIRPKKATIANLTANVAINDVVYTVASTTGFSVGDQVIMTDSVVRGGLTGGAERNFSNCGTIIQLTATTITVDEPAKYVLLTAQGAKIGHFNTAILCDNITNVVIKGSGVINGNKASQHVGEPVNSIGEEVKFGCGISVYNSTNVTIDGSLEIKNSPLHNIFVGTWEATKSTGLVVKGIDAHSCRDKNILAVNTDGLYINNVNVHDAKYEDGIMLYLGNINYIIDGVICNDNPRNGVSALSGDSIDGLIKNVTLSDMMAISSSNTHLENIDINTGGLLIIESAYGAVENVTLDGVEMIGLSGTASIQLLGELDGITFNDLTINDSAASIAHIVATDRLSGGVYPQNVEFHNGGIFNSTGTPTAINAGADVTFNNFAGL